MDRPGNQGFQAILRLMRSFYGGKVYPWEKIIDAHKLMESNANSGKIVLTISDHPIGDLPVTVKQPEASESKKAESSGKDGEKSGRDAQHKHIIDIISKQLIPPMSGKLHKGQAGELTYSAPYRG